MRKKHTNIQTTHYKPSQALKPDNAEMRKGASFLIVIFWCLLNKIKDKIHSGMKSNCIAYKKTSSSKRMHI